MVINISTERYLVREGGPQLPLLSHKIKFLKNKQQAVIITIKKAIEKNLMKYSDSVLCYGYLQLDNIIEYIKVH